MWLGRHALLLIGLAAFAVLGHWQWDVAASNGGSLQNLYYAVQWWAFGVIALVVWAKAIRLDTPEGRARAAAKRDARLAAAAALAQAGKASAPAALRFADPPAAAAEGASAPPASPTAAPPPGAGQQPTVQPGAGSGEPSDAELADYNAYLASLAASPRR